MASRLATVATILVWLACAPGAAAAEAGSTARGRRIVARNCSQCHAVGLRGESRLKEAPAFRDLHERYPIEMLAEALAEGVLTGHPAMPEFRFTPREINDIIAYLNSIQAARVSNPPRGAAGRGERP